MRAIALMVALASLNAPAYANVVINGDFETGTFAGWSLFATSSNASLGTPSGGRAIVPFDVQGSGSTTNAARFQVGQNIFTSGIQEGGGIRQTIITTSGMATFHADIAAQETNGSGNGAAGLFSVLLDGVVLSSFDFGDIGIRQIERNTFDFTAPITDGQHVLSLQMTRPFGAGGQTLGLTPFQYWDNVSLNVTSVSEPASVLLLGLALAALAIRRRRLAA
jgi:hypothetical protein